ncbi:hypothetical protein LV84_04301 [Algoriphagus ratkowskyi]|uniref:Fibronectin type III domain-containing protein n=1 Tax=Algoriphagus ratkowskyi TaxID=57028 RepID=A0A2W7QKT7_9BACT|nr:fibronectin type III domain-containing protein [Algoriphagus ratkowskyi]PZX49034.1 hypothetical protein LV84_04301 [Algoriphagus ratkowskyi]TXD75330.1 fibronectin type III domain-containing protein [Algoriphagus ratkowskyi]
MRTYIYFIIILPFFLSCNSNLEDTPTNDIDKNNEVENLAPEVFKVYIDSIASDKVSIRWDEAKDPEGFKPKYHISLQDSLILTDFINNSYTIEDLKELTLYKGQVIAEDNLGKQTAVEFEFTTTKYYLNFLKYLNFNLDHGCSDGFINSIFEAGDGNYFVLGKASENGYSYFNYATKIDPLGNSIWVKYYPYDNGYISDFGAARTKTGFLIVSDYYVLKLDQNGNEIWAKVIDKFNKQQGGVEIMDIVEDLNGDIYLIGDTDSENENVIQQGVLMKLNEDGNILWKKEFKESLRNNFRKIIITPDQKLLILGAQDTSGCTRQEYNYGNCSQIDFWLLKLTKGGDILWEKTYGDQHYDFPESIITLSNGNYVFGGFRSHKFNSDYKARIFEVNPLGEEIWNLTHTNGHFYSIKETSDKGLIVLGGVDNFAYATRISLTKFNHSRIEEWNSSYGEDFTNIYARDIILDSDEGFRIAASSWTFKACDGKILFIKTDPLGNF